MSDLLSVRLREGTRESHRLSEQTPFIQSFFAGRLSVEAYREFLLQLMHVYQAFEAQHRRHQEHPVLGRVYYSSLFREAALRQDLAFFYEGSQWKKLKPHAVTQAYVQRLESLSSGWVEGLVAHHYTRYLGDLSGGQILGRIVARSFGLATSEGLAFFAFPQIEDHSRFKDDYRRRLDSLPVDEATAGKIVDEANRAFSLNRELFEFMALRFAGGMEGPPA